MIDKNLNFNQLLSSYLYCKSINDFVSNEHGFYDVTNLSLLKSLIDSVKLSKDVGYEKIRLKIAFSYLINQYGAFLKDKTEDIFFSILTTLFNDNLNRFVTLDILTELRSITLKKASVLLDEGFFKKNQQKVQDFINDHFFVTNDDQNEVYTNEFFYNDLCEIFDQKLDFKNSSIIYEISKSFDFKDENEEEILIKKLQSLQSGTDYIISPSIRKIKPKTNNESTEATGTLNVRNNDEETEKMSPVIDFKKRVSAAFEEPTASKLRATRISSIDFGVFQQETNEDSDDELNFELSPPARKINESKKSTSSPKPTTTTSKKANLINTDSEEESKKKRKNNVSKNKDSSSDERSYKKSGKKKIKLTKKLEKSVNKISDISNIDSDTNSNTSLTSELTKSTKQSKRIKWSEKETMYLAIGVELYGKGCWSQISKRFKEQLKSRSTVQLKDKYRNMERANEIKYFSTLAKNFIDKNNIEN